MRDAPALEVTHLKKQYQGLRPLRVEALVIQAGERVAVAGLDAMAAEVFINLLTGATLPDEGQVRVCGRSTRDIAREEEWLAMLDRFGLVSHRSALLETATVTENLAMPFTLRIDDIPGDVRGRVQALADEVLLAPNALDGLVAEAPPEARLRLRLARAIALEPAILVLEHPTAAIPASRAARFASDVARIAQRRGLAVLALTEDARFAARVATRSLRLQGATGALVSSRGRRWWWR